MSKLKHVNLKNLIYLTGLKDSLVCLFASTLDCVLGGLESGNREQDTTFKSWRKGATFNRFTHHDVNQLTSHLPMALNYPKPPII